MEKEQCRLLQKATQDARRLLEEEFRSQLLQTYDIDVDKMRWADQPGAHLQAEKRSIREKLVAWIEHKEAQINDHMEALVLALREMAFTVLNRFVALKLMEARELVRPCLSNGLESAGFREFMVVAEGLLADQESNYRLYLETIFEDVSRELRALFDPRDPASLLWPKRTALLELLEILNRPELSELWSEDETLGWVYQYFNGNDERKKMRAESRDPRNSRELAVRNQFFTPRYVVEFLTDNSLGRIWYEMRHGNTRLKNYCRYLVRRLNEIWLQSGEEHPVQAESDENFCQEELLRQPVHIPHRLLKDPREIRMLDPACGSMHFGLYAFDLYSEIYAEAWEIAQGSDEQAKGSEAFSPFIRYASSFTDKADFLREIPRLILQYNIHGIDIDPRATQIARLTLWLRAQRAWQQQQVEITRRPSITRSNVVCAEPMPGERELLGEFVDRQLPEAEQGIVHRLLKVIFNKMELAGEAGSLLKIEKEIRDSIDEARREWQKLAFEQQELFSPAELETLGQVGSSLIDDIQYLSKDFWAGVEERIYKALSDYSEQTEANGFFQRRLFAEDASQGFAFIDTCRKNYDAVCMNPPFGSFTISGRKYARSWYKNTWQDIYSSFFDRALEIVKVNDGYVGAITPRSFYHAKGFCGLRSFFKSEARIDCSIDIGGGVLDAAVDVCLSIVESRQSRPDLLAPFCNLVSCDKRSLPKKIFAFAHHVSSGIPSDDITVVSVGKDSGLPNEMLPHRFPSELLQLFQTLPSFEASSGSSVVGITTFNNERFIRLTWEISERSKGSNEWLPVAMGGGWNPFYSEFNLVVKWAQNAAEMQANELLTHNTTARTMQSQRFWLRPGLTFSKISKTFSVQPFPKGSIFTNVGFCIFSEKFDNWSLLGYFNSKPVCCILSLFSDDRHWHSNSVACFPVPLKIPSKVAKLAKESYAILAKILGQVSETSPEFLHCERRLDERASSLSYERLTNDLTCEISALLGLSKLTLDFLSVNGTYADKEFSISSAELAKRRLSYCLGSTIGRWDIRYATGEQATPDLPDPFAPLSVCPPGQLQNTLNLPARPEDVPAAYPVQIPWDGILVDDPNHPLDIDQRVREMIEVIWGCNKIMTAQLIEQQACKLLGITKLRDWFCRPTNFFKDHLKRYSKSKRQAPIYWLLSAGSGSYSVWLYYQYFTADTLYRVLHDFVEPRIQQVEHEQFELESQEALSGDVATRFQKAQSLLADLRILKGELDLVAPLWNPNLNDGVIINHSILWRITPYTPWQEKCKKCWDKLVRGDYDWAHLAFHLWPDRVIPKCTIDRSLAIAHGLEERLWQETNNGNWFPQQLSDADLQALIDEYTNLAVKSALERFLAAPPPVAPVRTRAKRSSRTVSGSTPRRSRSSRAVIDPETIRQVLLTLTAAPVEGLSKKTIAELQSVNPKSLTAVIKQLKESGQIEQLGSARGAKYCLTEQGEASIAAEAGGGAP